jgi:nigerose phosphorylase
MTKLEPSWSVQDDAFDRDAIAKNGSKFIIANGHMGFRGTLEEFSAAELVSCTLSGLYDKVGNAWREPINAPNAFFTRVTCNDVSVSALATPILRHRQGLDLRSAVHFRETCFAVDGGNELLIQSERFLSLTDVHVGCLRHAVTPTQNCRLIIETGIDGDVWDLNGPHLENMNGRQEGDVILLESRTQGEKVPVVVSETIIHDLGTGKIHSEGGRILRTFEIEALAGVTYAFTKYICIRTGADCRTDVPATAVEGCLRAAKQGYDNLHAGSKTLWDQRWKNSDVQIEDDDTAQLALRYSIYHLLIIAPAHSERISIPARGLSGQVYKGSVFWDTEVFMMPFFDHTQPEIARNIALYRYHTLDGARRKAVEYGCRGAFYAWESQDTGDDACTLFNVTDILTGRPMRTHFRDKQIHISADVAFGLWRHYLMSGDEDFLLQGGAEVILECARFFVSYGYFKPDHDRYELLDVVGPDEYHERVDNNAFTNAMAREALGIALKVLDLLGRKYPERHAELVAQLDYNKDIERIRDMHARLFIPAPDAETGVIEQFSGYHNLEDASLAEVKGRTLHPKEYWGGGHGVASDTRIIKQADVVLMLHLFQKNYSREIKQANWEYYEPRTEHGSSLSPCVYALVAAEIGKTDWAYRYFLKTATIDLTGESKQYIGSIYIGGTHPAANGGAWMAAVLGFGGLLHTEDGPRIAPRLPAGWQRLTYRFCTRSCWFSVSITPEIIEVTADRGNPGAPDFHLPDGSHPCAPGETITSASNTAVAK